VCANNAGAVEEEITQLVASPSILAAERDGLLELAAVPNDPYYPLQWGLPKVGAPRAWDATRGSTEVLVAVVDTGYDYTHPDAPYDLWLGYDFGDGDTDPFDTSGHGTHVMGIAASLTHNSEGIAGLCAGCSALTIRVEDSWGQISESALGNGIHNAAYNGVYLAKRTVINVSIGGSTYNAFIADSVAYAQGTGALVIAAAGNGGPGTPSYPAALPGVIAVSATDRYDGHAPFSQYGDIGAPGVEILSTVPLWATAPPYDWMPGTSMASPLVAGAAGLVWSAHPAYTASQVTTALLAHVDVPAGWNPLYGAGRLNVARAVGPPPTLSHKVYLPLAMR